MIHHFVTIARILNGVRNLKIITFGPRPQDFACNAPIKPLYDLGMVSIQENSELDLLNAYKAHESDARIHQVALEMAEELHQPEVNDILLRLAQYELTLLDWKADNMGSLNMWHLQTSVGLHLLAILLLFRVMLMGG